MDTAQVSEAPAASSIEFAPFEPAKVEYGFRDEAGNVETHVAGGNTLSAHEAAVKRAGQLLYQVRMQKLQEKRMLRAAINLEELYKRKVKNRKKNKLAKASRKRNR